MSSRTPDSADKLHTREFPDAPKNEAFYVPAAGGHRIFVQLMGHPGGQPVVVMHGGPGSGCNAGMAAPFDLSRFRLVLIDQRGCGKSHPGGTLRQNTTQWLVSDVERVREWLGISRWHVYGGSWGATLALAYAGTHPNVVNKLLLRSLFLASSRETRNLLGLSRLRRPNAWRKLYQLATADATHTHAHRHSSDHPQNENLRLSIRTGAYCGQPDWGPSRPLPLLQCIGERLSLHGRHATAVAQAYSDLERALLYPFKPPRHAGTTTATRARQLRAKYAIQSYFLLRRCFLDRATLTAYAQRAHHAGIGGVALHGRHDPLCPPSNMDWLRRHMPGMEIRFVDAMHLASEPSMAQALKQAVIDIF